MTKVIEMDRETYNKLFMEKWKPVIDELKAQGKVIDNIHTDEDGFYHWLNRKELRKWKKATRKRGKLK